MAALLSLAALRRYVVSQQGFASRARRATKAELVVKAFHLEPRVKDTKHMRQGLDRALEKLRRVVGAEHVVRRQREG